MMHGQRNIKLMTQSLLLRKTKR